MRLTTSTRFTRGRALGAGPKEVIRLPPSLTTWHPSALRFTAPVGGVVGTSLTLVRHGTQDGRDRSGVGDELPRLLGVDGGRTVMGSADGAADSDDVSAQRGQLREVFRLNRARKGHAE